MSDRMSDRVTDRMIEAGALSLECAECASLEEQAIRAFRAMVQASPAFLQVRLPDQGGS